MFSKNAGIAIAIVVGHLAFRQVYYGAWLPNTFYAKVAWRAWWSMGFTYVGAFLLEYGALLWIPLLALAWVHHVRRGTWDVPILFAAATLPHLVYVASIGGDHFEYRPLDLYFPLAFVLIGDGLRELRTRGRPRLASIAAVVVFAGLLWLPVRSHLEFPTSRYITGFPGVDVDGGEAERFLAPDRDPLLRLPLIRLAASAHRELLRRATASFVGLRQEEHRLFLASVRSQAYALRSVVREGALPGTTRIALDCVGAVPYFSGLPTIDRLGLTDAWIAHAPSTGGRRFLGHEPRDWSAYAFRRGVLLASIHPAKLLFRTDDPELPLAIGLGISRGAEMVWAPVAASWVLLATSPPGLAAARRGCPSLRLEPLASAAAHGEVIRLHLEALRRKYQRTADPETEYALAAALLLAGEPGEARARYERVVAVAPDRMYAWKGLAGARLAEGDVAGALAALDRGLQLARRRGAVEAMTEFERLAASTRESRDGQSEPHEAR